MDLSDLKWRREIGTALATNVHLAHLVGCNGFFTALVQSARMRGDAELAEWCGQRAAVRQPGARRSVRMATPQGPCNKDNPAEFNLGVEN